MNYRRNKNTREINIIIKILLLVVLFLKIFAFLDLNNVFAADVKLECIPKNPRIGETFTVRVNITGSDCYSIGFTNLDESSNLEYISMDSEKTAEETTPLTGYIQAKFKVKDDGDAWVEAKLKIKSASLIDKKLDLNNITETVIDKKILISIIPKVKNIIEITGKYKVTENSVNIRPYPSTKYSSLGVYNKDKIIDIIGKSGDWYQFKYNNSDAFMHKDYLKELKEENEENEEIVKEEKDEVVVEDNNIVKIEENKYFEVKDPREKKDNTVVLIIFAVIVAIGIIIAIVFLLKQGKIDNDEYDDNDEYQEDNDNNEEN